MTLSETMQRLMGLDDEGLVPLVQPDCERVLLVRPEVNAAFSALIQRAQRAGFTLRACSAYRSFAAQAAIVSAKFEGKRPVLDALEQPLTQLPDEPAARLNAIMRFSALPGFSRHHWGSDLDVYAPSALPLGQSLQLTYHEYICGSYFHELGEFLTEHVAACGFYHPYGADADAMLRKAQSGALRDTEVGCEPWHISYRALAEECQALFVPGVALEYLATSDLVFAPSVRAVLTPERIAAVLALD